MRPFLAVASFLIVNTCCLAQDTILKATCDCFDRLSREKLDKIDYQFAYEYCLKEAYTRSISFATADSTEYFISNFLDQLGSSCGSYIESHEIVDKMTLEKSEIRVKNKRVCKQVMRVGEFEDRSGSEKVIMSMRDSVQIVTFGRDELYTKSRIEWTGDCTYKAIFVESTNSFENSLQKAGDEREVRILDIKNNGEIIFEVGMFDRWFLSTVYKIK